MSKYRSNFLNMPADYHLPVGTPFTLVLSFKYRYKNVETKNMKLIAWLENPYTGEIYNAHKQNGNTTTHQRNGRWTISYHKTYELAFGKAFSMVYRVKETREGLHELRQFIYGQNNLTWAMPNFTRDNFDPHSRKGKLTK